MRMPAPAVAVAAAAVAMTAAALPAAAGPARSFTIVIDKMRFGPAPAGARVGDTILWVNRDLFRHSATAADRSFDLDLDPGKAGRIRLVHAGTIRFACKYHPAMKGAITVLRR
jgi:plastocyanin